MSPLYIFLLGLLIGVSITLFITGVFAVLARKEK